MPFILFHQNIKDDSTPAAPTPTSGDGIDSTSTAVPDPNKSLGEWDYEPLKPGEKIWSRKWPVSKGIMEPNYERYSKFHLS